MFKSINRFLRSLSASFLPLEGAFPECEQPNTERGDKPTNSSTHNTDTLHVVTASTAASAHGTNSSPTTTDSFSCGDGGGGCM